MKKRLLKIFFISLVLLIIGACTTTKVDNSKANIVRQQLAEEGIPFSSQSLAHFAGEGDIAKVQQFLDAGMDINAMAGSSSAIMVAAAYQKSDMVRYLINHGADVNTITYIGSPLAVTAWNGNADIARMLLQSGANPDAVIVDGYTPLLIAALNDKAEFIKVLGEYGANVNYIHPVTGFTPLALAAYYSNKDAAIALIKLGANVNYIDPNNISVLDWSQISPNDDITRALVENGAKVEMKKNNAVPFVILAALAHENLPMVNFLINRGISVNGLADGKMPLVIWCAKCNVPNSALELIKLGADISVKDADGYSALDWAITNSEIKLVQAIDPKVDTSKLTIPQDPNVQRQATLVGDLINDRYYKGTVTSVESLEGALSGAYSIDTSIIRDTRSDTIFKNPSIKEDTSTTELPGWQSVDKFEDFNKQIQADMEAIDSSLKRQSGVIEPLPVESDLYNKEMKTDVPSVYDSIGKQPEEITVPAVSQPDTIPSADQK